MTTPRVDIYNRSPRLPGARRSDEEPFLRRLLLMPFLPSMWSRAADGPISRVAVPLLLLVALVGGIRGLYSAASARLMLRRAAREYAQKYPGFTASGGTVTVDGDGVVHFVDGDRTILVDPGETIPMDVINTPNYLVVRRYVIHARDGGETQQMKIADLQKRLGVDPLRVDGATLRAFDRKWGLWALLGWPPLTALVAVVSEAVGVLTVGSLSALIAWTARGQRQGLGFAACFAVTLAAYSALVVIEILLDLVGLAPGACGGIVVWTALLSALAAWRVGRD